MRETEVQGEIVNKLRSSGWFVTITSQTKSTQRQMSGFPDLVAFRDNITLLIECKGEGGKLRESQTKFVDRIHEHLGDHLFYIEAWHPLQLPRWVYE